jgi:hypothetical protein
MTESDWHDVDLDRARLTVNRQLLRNGHEVSFGRPKTDAGRRCIALDALTVEVLRRHRDQHDVTRRGSDLLHQDGVMPPMHQEAAARVAARLTGVAR